MIARFVLIFLLAWGAMAWQDRPIPDYPGDDNPQHNGQPMWCQARDENGHKKNCGVCDMHCSQDGTPIESNKCRVYCRHGACRCHRPCITSTPKGEHGRS